MELLEERLAQAEDLLRRKLPLGEDDRASDSRSPRDPLPSHQPTRDPTRAISPITDDTIGQDRSHSHILNTWDKIDGEKDGMFRDRMKLEKMSISLATQAEKVKNNRAYQDMIKEELAADSVRLKAEQGKLNVESMALDGEIDAVTTERSRLLRTHDRLNDLEYSLESRTLDMGQQEGSVALKSQGLEGKRSSLQKHIYAQRKEIRERQEEVLLREDELTKHQVDLRRVRERLEREQELLNKDKENLERERVAMEVAKERMRRTRDELESSYSDLQKSQALLKSERKTLQQELNKLEGVRRQVHIDSNRINEEGNTIVNLKNDAIARKKRIEDEAREVQNARIKLKRIKHDLSSSKRDTQLMKEELMRQKKTFDDKQGDLDDESARINHERELLKANEQKLAGERLEIAKEWNELRNQKQTVQDTLKLLVDEKAKIETNQRALQAKDEELSRDGMSLQQQRQLFEKEKLSILNTLEQQQNELRREVESFQNRKGGGMGLGPRSGVSPALGGYSIGGGGGGASSIGGGNLGGGESQGGTVARVHEELESQRRKIQDEWRSTQMHSNGDGLDDQKDFGTQPEYFRGSMPDLQNPASEQQGTGADDQQPFKDILRDLEAQKTNLTELEDQFQREKQEFEPFGESHPRDSRKGVSPLQADNQGTAYTTDNQYDSGYPEASMHGSQARTPGYNAALGSPDDMGDQADSPREQGDVMGDYAGGFEL